MLNGKELDLDALDTGKGAEEGFALTLTHPKSGEPLPAKITVLGAESDAYRSKQREFLRRSADRVNRTRKLVVSPEELEAEALELLVTATTGWDWGGMTLGGQPAPVFTHDAARQIYTRFGWIREQVDQAVGDRANFLPRSASSS